MSVRVRIMLAFVAVSCVAGFSLLLIFNDTVRSVILEPIIEGVNAVRYVLGYMPQDAEWLVILIITFVVVLGIFATRLPHRPLPIHVPFVPHFPSEGESMKLTHIINQSSKNRFSRERVILELRDLAAHTVAYREGISVEEAKESLDAAEWTESTAIRDFLSLDKHRAGKNDHRQFHEQVDRALAHIERMYQEV